MLLAFVLLFLITAGGFVVTYLYDEDAPFVTRVFAGVVIGQVIYSLAGFLLGWLVGMSAGVSALCAVITALPLLLINRKNYQTRVAADFSAFSKSVKDFIAKPTLETAIWAGVYGALLALLWFFFERAMLNINGGVGTGNIHNTGDISFHLQAIYSFLDGQNFPPQNPSFAGGKFTYPFMADLVTAMLASVGALISEAKFWQNMLLIVALIVLLRRFTFKLTSNSFAANVAPLILLFSGGLGFMLFFNDSFNAGKGVLGLLMDMQLNYTIRDQGNWRWGNSLTVLFMTQRSILFGMPLALIILTKIWDLFSQEDKKAVESSNFFTFSPLHPHTLSALTVGLLAGTLPLVHAHSFAVVMGMAGLLALMSYRRWREWIVFFAAAAVISVPELLWATRNTANKMSSFIAWEFGWDNGEADPALFWLKNTGFFIPLLLAALVALFVKQFLELRKDDSNDDAEERATDLFGLRLLLFWLPFALCFIVPNVMRMAPWIWDNIKVLIYWFVASIPLVAWLLALMWQRGKIYGKIACVGLLVGLMLSGFLDVWRVASRQMEYTIFNRDAVALAREARAKIPPHAIVASAPAFDSSAALMGRRWFMGFVGHVWSHGIDPSKRENDLREIYYGGPNAEKLIREYEIDYLVLTPQEYNFTVVNDAFLRRYPVVAQVGEYRLIKVR